MSIGGASIEKGGSGRGGCGGADRAVLRDDEEKWKGAMLGDREIISGEGNRKKCKLRGGPGMGYDSGGKYGGQISKVGSFCECSESVDCVSGKGISS